MSSRYAHTKAERDTCYYCFAPLSKSNREDDHFPMPFNCGGTVAVPCCVTCHDLKDRFPLADWSIEMLSEFLMEFSTLHSRTMRIFIAKSAAALSRANKEHGESLLSKEAIAGDSTAAALMV